MTMIEMTTETMATVHNQLVRLRDEMTSLGVKGGTMEFEHIPAIGDELLIKLHIRSGDYTVSIQPLHPKLSSDLPRHLGKSIAKRLADVEEELEEILLWAEEDGVTGVEHKLQEALGPLRVAISAEKQHRGET